MTSKYTYSVKIPKDRVAVLIGQNGTVKKELEEYTKSKILIDSQEGDVTIEGEDSLKVYNAREIVKAIARGFNPEYAKLLLKQDYTAEIINLPDFLGKSTKKIIRMKGRVIGSHGKSRKIIEDLTETRISVYGKTIGILGFYEDVIEAKRAIESLLTGSPHSTVFKWLERNKVMKHMKEEEEF
jgi:ribosomal RNA assembly protein